MGPVKFILSFCISFTILIGSTIEISVSGTVIRENNNAPLEGANVVFVSEGGEEFGASTDVSGKFNLNNFEYFDVQYDTLQFYEFTFADFFKYENKIMKDDINFCIPVIPSSELSKSG